MNVESLSENVDKLESVFLNMIYSKPEDQVIAPSMSNINDLKDAINDIFDENKCIDVYCTQNTDKQFFGIKISPAMSASDVVCILSTEDRVKLQRYKIEFDSKLFEIGLDARELTALTIYEVSAIMDSYEIFDNLRAMVDTELFNNDDAISLRDSVNHAMLVIFAVKDTLRKLASILYKETDQLAYNPAIQATNLYDELISAKEKISSAISGEDARTSDPAILKWMLFMYRDMKLNSYLVKDTLKDAKDFTGSKLEIEEIDATIDAIDRLGNMTITESNCDIIKFFDKKNISAVNEISLFKSLKKNGLRGIENDLYEYSMRVKNCNDQEEAYLIMRGLNNRLGVLEDYLYNEDMSDHDRKHWELVAAQYRSLRETLAKKKIKEKQYGLFFDYSALDALDKPKDEE